RKPGPEKRFRREWPTSFAPVRTISRPARSECAGEQLLTRRVIRTTAPRDPRGATIGQSSTVGQELLAEAARDLILERADRLVQNFGELAQEQPAYVFVEARDLRSGNDLLSLQDEEIAEY